MLQMMMLIDGAQNLLATAQVAEEGLHYGGTIDLASTPADLRALFDKFEAAVNDQQFSYADEIQGKIASYGIRARRDDGFEVDVTNLQVFPSTGDISFKLAGSPTQAVKSA